MKNVLLPKAIKLNKDRKQRKWWQRAVRVMAMAVVFCTTYALILPAITMEGEPACGIEAHTHEAGCYTEKPVTAYVCGLEKDLHTHTDTCYAQTTSPACQYVHTHTDSCAAVTKTVLTCTLEESQGHAHSEACATTERVLICTLAESASHTHGEGCTAAEQVQVCTLEEGEAHAHGAECFTTQTKTVCTLAEGEGHTHGDACYETKTVPCQIPESEGHAHGESCYTQQQVPCDLTVNDGHVHGESCYVTEKTLTCTIPGEAPHVHVESCLQETGEMEQVLTCELPEHTHEDSCYPLEEEETGSEYLCGMGVHAHGAECYDAEGNLFCTIPEHAHEAACLVEDLDLTAGVETAQDWQDMFADLTLTGNWPEDLLAVANTQLGYKESEKNVILTEDGLLKGYTRYGAWYGTPYGDWNESFAAFCLHFAEIENFPTASDCESWIEALTEAQRYAQAEGYTPKPGDLVFFDDDRTAEALEAAAETGEEIPVTPDRVAIVAELIAATAEEPAKIKVIEGDSNNAVSEVTCDQAAPAIIGYGILPEHGYVCGQEVHTHEEACYDEAGALTCELPEHSHSEACWKVEEKLESVLKLSCVLTEHTHSTACFGEDAMLACGLTEHTHDLETCYENSTADFTYENDLVSVAVHVVAPQGIPEGVTMTVAALDMDDETHLSYEDYALENAPGELFSLDTYEIRFFQGETEVELKQAEITVSLTVKDVSVPEVQPVAAFSLRSLLGAEETEEESQEKQLHLTALTNDGSGVSQGDSYVPEQDSTEPAVMTFTLGNARSFALTRSVEPLPTFTVEYYNNMLRYYDPAGSNETLNVINTATTSSSVPVAGEARGGSMPVNGKGSGNSPNANDIYILNLEPSSTHAGYYRVAMDYELVEVYQAQENVIYSNAMTSYHMDVLRDNDHYGVTDLQVKRAGEDTWTNYPVNDKTKINDTTYTWHDVDDLYYFTNNPSATTDAEGREPIVITEGMTLRYLYYPTSGNFSANSLFHDYDISDGTHNVSGKVTTMDTYRKGINSTANYGNKSGPKLAFGNSNTGSGRQGAKHDGYFINQYNSSSFKGLHFGIVSGYDKTNQTPIYNGIADPNMFGTASATGKTTYQNTKMNFRRDGDTYTLTSVSGADGISDSNLELFEVTYEYDDGSFLLSNSFWPFDKINDGTNGHDIHFGSANAYANGYEKFNGRKWTEEDGYYAATGNLPKGDEGKEHNSYFGLQFSIDFHLDGSYSGPLEYLFYGDDDMWVFLEDKTTGKINLIADIGGVHSSVGSYTDLWDWVPNTDARPNGKGDYTLYFFYTERGASGSSCYMQFTIPDATSAPISNLEVGSVEVSKDIAGEMTSDEVFGYTYTITYPSNLAEAQKDRILPYTIYHADGTTTSGALFREGQFTLLDGEKIIIGNIPVGSEFSISETPGSNFDVEWTQVPSGATLSDGTVTGKINTSGQHLQFGCTNTYNSLTLHKQVEAGSGEVPGGEFAFDVTFTDANGAALTGTIHTVTHGADGTYSTPTTHTLQDGKLSVKLKAAESISFYPLPDDTGYTITETDGLGLMPFWPVSAEEELRSDSIDGTVPHGNVEVTCINKVYYVLPNTGGSGTFFFTFGGLLMMAVACVYYVNQIGRKRQKGGAGSSK